MKHIISLTLIGALLLALAATGLARAEEVTLRVGDQKAGLPILEALNTEALDVGYTGDLAFLTVYSAGAPIRAIGGSRSAARSQAILVPKDSPARTLADLKGKRLAGNKGGWGQFLIDATLEKAGHKIDDATFAPLGRWMPRSPWSRARSTVGPSGSPTFPMPRSRTMRGSSPTGKA